MCSCRPVCLPAVHQTETLQVQAPLHASAEEARQGPAASSA